MNFIRSTVADPDYQRVFGNVEVRGFEVHNDRHETIGKVAGVLMDAVNRSQFLVLDIGSWLSWKRVITPLSQFQIDANRRCLSIAGLTKEKSRDLPAFDSNSVFDYAADSRYSSKPETKVAHSGHSSTPLEVSAPLETSSALEDPSREPARTIATTDRQISPVPVFNHREEMRAVDQLDLPQPSGLTDLNSSELNPIAKQPAPDSRRVLAEEEIQLLSERLIVDRHRRKVGEVIVRKEIETQIVEVPVRREKLIIEQVSPEHKQLAVVDLCSKLESVDLREPIASESLISDRNVANRGSDATAFENDVSDRLHSVQDVPLALAAQILGRLVQSAQFKESSVKLLFSEPKLQTQYERWLQEHRSQSV